MNRSFTVSALIAGSAHAVLMFGFTPPPKLPLIKTVCTDHGPTCCPPVPITIAEPPPEEPLLNSTALPRPDSTPQPHPAPEPLTNPAGGDVTLPPCEMGAPSVNVPYDLDPSGLHSPGLLGGPNNGPGGPLIYSALKLDNTPRARLQTPPAYPASLKANGVHGEVLVEFVVDETGRVINPRVMRSSHPELEAPTLTAVVKWRFEPGTRDLVPVRFRMSVPVTFNVNE